MMAIVKTKKCIPKEDKGVYKFDVRHVKSIFENIPLAKFGNC